jgi:ribosomal protein L7Ae-like RNA K-turn-binding protein
MSQQLVPTAISDQESKILERIKRALAHRRESGKNFISFSSDADKCDVKLGLRATLRAIQNGSAGLVVVAQRGPSPTVDLIIELTSMKLVTLWSPPVSSNGLGRRLGLNAPCQAFVILNGGKETDPFVSIREFVIKNIAVHQPSDSDMDDAKRRRLSGE